jgi:Putative prokaryotic signal transducing protein
MALRTLSWGNPPDEHSRAEPVEPARATTGGGGGSGVGPVCIGVVAGPLRAEIARSFLEQAGISVYLQGTAVAAAYGLAGGPLAEVRVFVPAAQAEEAARIFAELDFGGDDQEATDADNTSLE